MTAPSVSVVIITRDRRPELLRTLDRLQDLVGRRELHDLVVVDNGSTDGSAAAVRERFPGVRVLALPENLAAAGRTLGARATDADLVAFADDDSWWQAGALPLAADLFGTHAGLGLLHARIVVHPGERTDPVCVQMARGRHEAGTPGPAVLGHLACGVVVRREAYLGVGGYDRALGVGGEERLLALDLAAAGWHQAYVEDVVAHHQPSSSREAAPRRRARCRRNDCLTAVLRLPAGRAVRECAGFLREAGRDPASRAELLPFLRRLPGALARRRPVPPEVLEQLRRAEATAFSGSRV